MIFESLLWFAVQIWHFLKFSTVVCLMFLVHGHIVVHAEQDRPMCAKWRKDVLETFFCIHSLYWLNLSVSILAWKNHTFRCGFLVVCVPSFLVTSELQVVHAENTFPHTRLSYRFGAEQVMEKEVFCCIPSRSLSCTNLPRRIFAGDFCGESARQGAKGGEHAWA